MCKFFVRMLGICACQAIERDLESSSTMKKVHAWICAPPTTHHDPASVIPDKKRKSATTVFFFADLLFLEVTSYVLFSCFLLLMK